MPTAIKVMTASAPIDPTNEMTWQSSVQEVSRHLTPCLGEERRAREVVGETGRPGWSSSRTSLRRRTSCLPVRTAGSD
eukprot:2466393-Rhodomonas_salina.1